MCVFLAFFTKQHKTDQTVYKTHKTNEIRFVHYSAILCCAYFSHSENVSTKNIRKTCPKHCKTSAAKHRKTLFSACGCGQAVGCGVCDTPKLWCGAAGLCARVRACAGAAESLHTHIHEYILFFKKHSQNTTKHPQNTRKTPQNTTKHHKTHLLLTKQTELANKPLRSCRELSNNRAIVLYQGEQCRMQVVGDGGGNERTLIRAHTTAST